MAGLEMIGLYRVPDTEPPAYLVEFWLRGHQGLLDFADFGQQRGGDPDDDPVAYCEYELAEDGKSGRPLDMGPHRIAGDLRVALFMHGVDETLPLQTPFGPVALPPMIFRPRRLDFIEYVAPD